MGWKPGEKGSKYVWCWSSQAKRERSIKQNRLFFAIAFFENIYINRDVRGASPEPVQSD